MCEIKRNGYPQCQRNGRKQAVEALKRMLAYDGMPIDKQKWTNIVGIIKVTDDLGNVYTIEERMG